MQLINDFHASSPPPQWLVSNGNVTVGPVGTDLLLRGVMHGRVPSTSLVRQPSWEHWREVGKIREVSALKRVLERSFDDVPLESSTLHDSAAAVAQATDLGEALLIALHAAARATSATVGLAHRVREPLLLPTTSCAFADSFEAAPECLGEVLPWYDPAFTLARAGRVRLLRVSERPKGVERVLCERLSPTAPLKGVAMLPILVEGKLHAMLELGRSDRPFRASDSVALFDFSQRVALTFKRLLGEDMPQLGV
ncbi:MAG: hypothetical protein ABUL62_16490 [Myxococcales bacterium]